MLGSFLKEETLIGCLAPTPTTWMEGTWCGPKYPSCNSHDPYQRPQSMHQNGLEASFAHYEMDLYLKKWE